MNRRIYRLYLRHFIPPTTLAPFLVTRTQTKGRITMMRPEVERIRSLEEHVDNLTGRVIWNEARLKELERKMKELKK